MTPSDELPIDIFNDCDFFGDEFHAIFYGGRTRTTTYAESDYGPTTRSEPSGSGKIQNARNAEGDDGGGVSRAAAPHIHGLQKAGAYTRSLLSST